MHRIFHDQDIREGESHLKVLYGLNGHSTTACDGVDTESPGLYPRQRCDADAVEEAQDLDG